MGHSPMFYTTSRYPSDARCRRGTSRDYTGCCLDAPPGPVVLRWTTTASAPRRAAHWSPPRCINACARPWPLLRIAYTI
uniref:Cytochrome P450 6k1 n=1 Tax=Cydia pomonella TaxID=82600 RepID=A0A346II33_CYDPO|nr:cytochrome P450 6k1 [Cydia pomonella]